MQENSLVTTSWAELITVDYMEEYLDISVKQALKIIQERIINQTTYFGIKTLKNPLDYWVYQEIIFETRPDFIIEIGNYRGGSTLALAHICDCLGKGRVIGIDISHENVPNIVREHARITLFEGDACELFETVSHLVNKEHSVLIIEDRSHTYDNTLRILRTYSSLVKPGCYFIVEDSICHHGLDIGPKPGPYEAINTFISENRYFAIDRSREAFLITWNPNGYLKRVDRPTGKIMRESIKEFVGICAQTLPIQGPIFEFGSLQVAGQEGYADLRTYFPGLKYFGCDMRAGVGVDKILNLHEIELPSESVDTVLSFDTLEHVEFPHKAMSEIFRILKPGGIAIISSVMNFPIHEYPQDYWRFTPEAFKSILKPFSHSFVDFAGDEDFPHTVVGIGFKSNLISLDQFLAKFKGWKERWSHSDSQKNLDNCQDGEEAWKRVVKLFLPPIFLHFYQKLINRK